jgi:hypothetical protein
MPVCVFDLDHTLTCGNAERAIRRCQEHGFDLAVNTARPHPWLDRKLHGLGLPAPGSAAFVHNPHSYQQTAARRARFKGDAMHRLAQHFGTDQLVLFDDLPENVEAARRAGYHGQLVGGDGTCGIAEADLAVLKNIRALTPSSSPGWGRPGAPAYRSDFVRASSCTVDAVPRPSPRPPRPHRRDAARGAGR